MNYQQSIEFIQSFPDAERGLPGAKPARSLKMPLSSMKALLQTLGNPQNAAKTIHITGSKGKGSTATFIATILEQAGLRTALFTSPHIHSYLERITFGLQPVKADEFAQSISELKPLIEKFDQNGQTVSTFGILTALFFQLVKSSKPPVHWQVVEVGLGGKDDVTNVFEHKEAVVITPISLEHTAILGSTRIAIAENKAGIITPGCFVVLAPQSDAEVTTFIRKICSQQKVELIEVDKHYQLPYPMQLLGDHQITNALTAVALIEALGKREKVSIGAEEIKNGLLKAFLPGRFEVIRPVVSSKPFLPTPPAGGYTPPPSSDLIARKRNSPAVQPQWMDLGESPPLPPQQTPSWKSDLPFTIVLDGAHNGESALALAKTLQQVFPGRAVVLIIGMNEDKDLEAMWLALKGTVSTVVATQSDNYRSLSPEEIHTRIQACDPTAQIMPAENIDDALKIATAMASNISRQKGITSPDQEAVICICGSLYLVAEAREKLMES